MRLTMIPTHNRFCTYAQTANTGTCRLGVIVGESPMDTKVDKPLRGFWVGSKAGATGIWTSVAITEQGKICDNNDIVSLLSSPSVFSITAPGLRDLHGNVGRFHAIETRLSCPRHSSTRNMYIVKHVLSWPAHVFFQWWTHCGNPESFVMVRDVQQVVNVSH